LELLTEEQRHHPAIVFCTQLDQYLMIGSYDQVIAAASHPPVDYFSFFLNSLLETVRVNIWECVLSSYRTLSLTAATDMLMFSNVQETKEFLESKYSDLPINQEIIDLTSHKNLKSEEELKSHRLIEQTLSYAAELERIV
jgi:26S proteasome regulatory subunit N12